jgi:hypothetical protein
MRQSTSDPDRSLESDIHDVEDSDTQREASRALATQREAAQGVDIFQNPDASIPLTELTEGPPGEETLVGDDSPDQDGERTRQTEDDW